MKLIVKVVAIESIVEVVAGIFPMGESVCLLLLYVYYVFLVQIRGGSLTSKWLVGCDGFLEFRCYIFMEASPKIHDFPC